MTADTYFHVMPEMGGTAARAIDAALEDRPGDGGPNLVPLEGVVAEGASSDGGDEEKAVGLGVPRR